jgi:Fe2+ or Zn2+ uptake regulation protein
MDPRGLLRAAGLRRTVARERILARLLATPRALCPTDLLGGAAAPDRVTVYRTLAALQAAGLAHAVCGTDGIVRYQAHDPGVAGCPGGHAHFQCRACGGVWCLPDQPLSHVTVPAGARVEGKQYVVFGRCPACAQEER